MTTLETELAKSHEQWRTLSLNDMLTVGYSRGPSAYRSVIDQFNVERSSRYAPRDGLTFCNIFVSDVTRAMIADIPHWVIGTTPATHKDDGARELTANATIDLMPAWNWLACTEAEAVQHANLGQPTVAAWKNIAGPGHIAMVVPSESNQVVVAQAGLICNSRIPLSVGFGSKRVKDVRYYWHP